jgi:hypothetical protein
MAFKPLFPWSRLLAAGVFSLVVMALWCPERFEAAWRLYNEALNPWSGYVQTGERTKTYWADFVRAVRESPFWGHGTGTASLGLQYVNLSQRGQLFFAPVEGGYAGTWWEWGAVGLALWFLWSFRLIFSLAAAWWRGRREDVAPFRASAFVFVFFILACWFFLGTQIYQNYITQAYVWFLSGMALRTARVAEKVKEEVPDAGV